MAFNAIIGRDPSGHDRVIPTVSYSDFTPLPVEDVTIRAAPSPESDFPRPVTPLLPKMAAATHFPKMADGNVVGGGFSHEVFHRRAGLTNPQPMILDGIQDTLVCRHDAVFDPWDDVRMTVGLAAGPVDGTEVTGIGYHADMGPLLVQSIGVPHMAAMASQRLNPV
jgi:hypothetical protein